MPLGGVVHFAAGTWLSGSIHLKSNVTLLLDQGLPFSPPPIQRPTTKPSLISGTN
jgi:polygalacturonase